MAINVKQLSGYMNAGLNIMIAGEAGTGKTAMLQEAAKDLGWTMKYYSASTLDPFADLIGIPVPNQETKTMEYWRDSSIDEADVIFFDEANRATDQVINSIFEITQFRSLNGKPLPKLKAVVIAINPVGEGYEGNQELDMAFVDRFDVFLESTVTADRAYFKKRFGATYAEVGLAFFKEYQASYNASLRSKQNAMGYLSPRRLEKMMANFQKFPTAETLKASVPSNVSISTRAVAQQFNVALAAQASSAKAAPVTTGSSLNDKVAAIKAIPARERRSASNRAQVKGTWDEIVAQGMVTDKLGQEFINAWMESHDKGVGPMALFNHYGELLQAMTPHQLTAFMGLWAEAKRWELKDLLGI